VVFTVLAGVALGETFEGPIFSVPIPTAIVDAYGTREASIRASVPRPYGQITFNSALNASINIQYCNVNGMTLESGFFCRRATSLYRVRMGALRIVGGWYLDYQFRLIKSNITSLHFSGKASHTNTTLVLLDVRAGGALLMEASLAVVGSRLDLRAGAVFNGSRTDISLGSVFVLGTQRVTVRSAWVSILVGSVQGPGVLILDLGCPFDLLLRVPLNVVVETCVSTRSRSASMVGSASPRASASRLESASRLSPTISVSVSSSMGLSVSLTSSGLGPTISSPELVRSASISDASDISLSPSVLIPEASATLTQPPTPSIVPNRSSVPVAMLSPRVSAAEVLSGPAATAVASTGSSAAALAGPGSASQAARAQAAVSLIACDLPDASAEPVMSEYPVRVMIGGSSLAGSVLVATGALLALQLGTYICFMFGIRVSFASGPGWAAGACSYMGPVVLGFYMPVVARDGALLAFHGNGVACVVGFGCGVVVLVCAAHLTVRVLFWAEMSAETRSDGRTEYVDAGTRPFLAQYGAYVSGCRSHYCARYRCYAAVETWAGIVVGILDGSRPSGASCSGYAYGILAVSVACALYHMVVRPLQSRLDQRFAWFRAFLECSVAGLVCASFWRSDFGAWAGWGAVALCAVFPVELAVGAVVWWRERQERRILEGGAIPILIPPGPGVLPPRKVIGGVSSSYVEEPLLAIPVANPLNC
jgi:hypothetical protein